MRTQISKIPHSSSIYGNRWIIVFVCLFLKVLFFIFPAGNFDKTSFVWGMLFWFYHESVRLSISNRLNGATAILFLGKFVKFSPQKKSVFPQERMHFSHWISLEERTEFVIPPESREQEWTGVSDGRFLSFFVSFSGFEDQTISLFSDVCLPPFSHLKPKNLSRARGPEHYLVYGRPKQR